MTVTRDLWLEFSPKGATQATGLIFYPGERISYLDYAGLMKAIAAASPNAVE